MAGNCYVYYYDDFLFLSFVDGDCDSCLQCCEVMHSALEGLTSDAFLCVSIVVLAARVA